jgi:hypothetical protein
MVEIEELDENGMSASQVGKMERMMKESRCGYYDLK